MLIATDVAARGLGEGDYFLALIFFLNSMSTQMSNVNEGRKSEEAKFRWLLLPY